MRKKIDSRKALKTLKTKNTYLVHWSPFNGEIRTKDGESLGGVSTRVIDNLLNSDLLVHMGNGTGLLDHETYYKLKDIATT